MTGIRRFTLSLLLLLLVVPGAARAAVTRTQITQPIDPAQYTWDLSGGQGPFGLRVAGKATEATGTGQTIDIRCYADNAAGDVLLGSLPVDDTTREFSGYLDVATLLRPCVLRAVPQGSGGAPPTIDATRFTGPRIYPTAFTDQRVRDLSSPSSGIRYDFYDHVVTPGRTSQFALGSLGFCGLYFAQPLDPAGDPSATQRSVFNCAGFADFTVDGTPSSRSGIVVDGHNAFTAGVLVGSSTSGAPLLDKVPGMPPLSVQRSFDGSTGTEAVAESSQVVRCATDLTTYPPATPETGTTACGSLVGSGVQYARTIQTSDDGRVFTVLDRWSSTDGQAHNLDLLLEQDMYSTAYGWQIPWVGPDFASYPGTASIGPSPSAPGTIYIRSDAGKAEGTEAPVGALTFFSAPDGIEFYDDGNPISAYPQLHYLRTVPASGELLLGFTYTIGTSLERVRELAGRAEDRYAGPTVQITSPANGAVVKTSSVSVAGRALDNGGVASLTVLGTPVGIAADGTWSAKVGLKPGPNPITVVATDRQGNQTQGAVTVTYTRPGAPCIVPSIVGLTRTAASKKLRARRCRLGATSRTYVRPKTVRRGSKRVRVAFKRYRIVRQRVKPGSKLANGAAIRVTIQGRKPKSRK